MPKANLAGPRCGGLSLVNKGMFNIVVMFKFYIVNLILLESIFSFNGIDFRR